MFTEIQQASEQTEESAQASLEQEFILGQLILLTQYQDYSDEVGRRQMETLVVKLLTLGDFEGEVLDALCKTLNLVCENLNYASYDHFKLMIDY